MTTTPTDSEPTNAGSGTAGSWSNSLRVQIFLLLTLALLPLGAVAIYQTNRVESQAERNGELALLALTGRAAKEEELFIQRAIGIARFFGTVAADALQDIDECNRDLRNFVDQNDGYSFVGIMPPSGLITCSSSGGAFDASTGPFYDQLMETKERTVFVNFSGPLSGESIFNISEPYEIDGEFAGFISISIPHRGLPQSNEEFSALGFVELFSINANGDILTARNGIDSAETEFPQGRSVESMRVQAGEAFSANNRNGVPRKYTLFPIEGSPVTMIGVWHVDDGLASRISTYIRPAVFPILMWMASTAVAMLSIYTLVLRHINSLRRNMDAFAETRSMDTTRLSTSMPNELQALANNFDRMTDDIVRDEAALENTLREKNVLIKEVHHRVKNNLQLISSIMNMQIRAAEQDETKSVLSRLQDRVLSLATIHRDLYQSRLGGLVDVGALVTEVVERSLEVAMPADDDLDMKIDIDRVLLYPDQAVPLSLLVAESMTNAMKYLGVPDGGKAAITVLLKQDDSDCILTLINTVGENTDAESTGLGAQLINAFSIQLGGQMQVHQSDGQYEMSLHFKIADFVPEGRDF